MGAEEGSDFMWHFEKAGLASKKPGNGDSKWPLTKLFFMM